VKVEAWDPDLRSLMARYGDGSLDLQPSFQRGLVWNVEKQAKLIDTILRGWRVPPIHYLVNDDESLAILDGQQRLTAMFDFIEGRFPVGNFPPYDAEISELQGLRFQDLPGRYSRRILDSRVSGYRLSDYSPQEPYELFFRLNSPTGLTQAEKRNALAGRARDQVKELVGHAEWLGWGKSLLGFGDGRLAYDDVVARLCTYLLRGNIRQRVDAQSVEHLYREPEGMPDHVHEWARSSIELFTWSVSSLEYGVRLNKATLLTWLLVAARAKSGPHSNIELTSAIERLEGARNLVGRRDLGDFIGRIEDPTWFAPLAAVYIDRSSLRVADALSVQARDAIAWLVVAEAQSYSRLPPTVAQMTRQVEKLPYSGLEGFEVDLFELLNEYPEWSQLR